jgi:hypothetical protein
VKILGLRLKMTKFCLVPQFVKITVFPQTWKNYRLVPGAYFEILNRTKDKSWAEFLYSYEILTLSIWSFNLTKITI